MNFKKIKSIVGVAIAVAVASTAVFAGCKKTPNDDNTLEVYCWDAGYGTDWVEPMLEDFGTLDWVQEKYPNFQYATIFNDDGTYGANRVDKGAGNTIDLFFTQTMESLYGTDTLVDLTECVYNQKVPGEDILYKDKMIPSLYENMGFRPIDNQNAELRYYSVPWASSIGGIVYNSSMLSDLGLSVPNTTNEMFKLLNDVKAKHDQGVPDCPEYPFSSSRVSYTAYMFHEWWAQYEGKGGYEDFWDAKAADGTRNSVSIFDQTGRLKALEVMRGLHNADNGYYYEESSTYDFIAGQTLLLTRDSLMMINGSWYANEMQQAAKDLKEEGGYDDTILMMKTPVVSAIVEKTPSIKAAATAAGKTDDEMLSAVIAEIDANPSALSSSDTAITTADYQKIREARGLKYSIAPTHNTVIPQAATAKELAIDFVRYLATDRACTLYSEYTSGGIMAFQYDFAEKAPEKFNQLMNEYPSTFSLQAEVQKLLLKPNTEILPCYWTKPLFLWGGVKPLTDTYGVENGFISNRNLTAQDVLKETSDYWKANGNFRWNEALRKAGMR